MSQNVKYIISRQKELQKQSAPKIVIFGCKNWKNQKIFSVNVLVLELVDYLCACLLENNPDLGIHIDILKQLFCIAPVTFNSNLIVDTYDSKLEKPDIMNSIDMFALSVR